MPRITLPDVEFEVFCTCGSGLCRSTSVDEYRNGEISLKIDPCENCLENAKQDGYNEGHDQGYDDAEAERREG